MKELCVNKKIPCTVFCFIFEKIRNNLHTHQLGIALICYSISSDDFLQLLKIMGQFFMYGYERIFNIYYFLNKNAEYRTKSTV